ncbi:hypothetical protein EV356DRAFT_568367 [Viridothelium virens]|uniref:Uncharacterized protein n=1 Tax=Viridothelium virens TaxID=1048519 RepID=A0A6A6H4Z2_VIRVR|nr:hypothetical protein EV356DRAFT_568367 [Viridothelium virens]
MLAETYGEEYDLKAFEMVAAGIWKDSNCIIIKGSLMSSIGSMSPEPILSRLDAMHISAKPGLWSNRPLAPKTLKSTVCRKICSALRPWLRATESSFLIFYGSNQGDWQKSLAHSLSFGFLEKRYPIIFLAIDASTNPAESLINDFAVQLFDCLQIERLPGDKAKQEDENSLLGDLGDLLKRVTLPRSLVVVVSASRLPTPKDAESIDYASRFLHLLYQAPKVKFLYLGIDLGVFQAFIMELPADKYFKINPDRWQRADKVVLDSLIEIPMAK